MVISDEQYRQFRVRTHHLDQRLPAQQLLTAAGTIGFQNSPPGAWEQAVFNRIADITAAELRAMLEEQKYLLQVWSFRGAPAVFPTQDAAVFLNALVAEKNEGPWIYTAGLVPSLPQLGIDYTTLLTVVGQATKAVLADKTITGKGQLDATIAEAVAADLPAAKQAAWQQPSPYGAKQTLGEAAVSFMLRPASFQGLVVFGKRAGQSPTFTSPQHWGVDWPQQSAAAQELVRRYVHAYGPTNRQEFTKWLGCSTAQGQRLWALIAGEATAVDAGSVLTADVSEFQKNAGPTGTMRLLGPHDPYLDANGRDLLLPDKKLQRKVWRTVGNPGAVLLDGQIVGVWRQRKQGKQLSMTVDSFRPLTGELKQKITEQAEMYAVFLKMTLRELLYQ
ncbi:winged helix DNA-binding domain-containing protein [Schleiferilactobacillus harbinensis]|uniref:Winged helix DNA-binding domain-containing protein n=1 Tax=Schleiferilactobacillus harbinensis TaxID=304207 RepID=A0ABU7T225_9LACO